MPQVKMFFGDISPFKQRATDRTKDLKKFFFTLLEIISHALFKEIKEASYTLTINQLDNNNQLFQTV